MFQVFECSDCKCKRNDEFIYIGRNVIAIYYLFDNCVDLEIDKELLVQDLDKFKVLIKDAILHQNEIFFCFLDDFKLEDYYDVFDKIIDEDLSVQIVVM